MKDIPKEFFNSTNLDMFSEIYLAAVNKLIYAESYTKKLAEEYVVKWKKENSNAYIPSRLGKIMIYVHNPSPARVRLHIKKDGKISFANVTCITHRKILENILKTNSKEELHTLLDKYVEEKYEEWFKKNEVNLEAQQARDKEQYLQLKKRFEPEEV
jgi:hypothetical protein